MVLPFSCEAIEKEMKLSIAAPLIEIFSRQDAALFVPATSLLVAVASMTCQFVFSQFFLECLLRTATGARKTKILPLNTVSPSPPLSRTR